MRTRTDCAMDRTSRPSIGHEESEEAMSTDSHDDDIAAALAGIRSRLDTLASITAEKILIPGGPQERYHQIIEEAYVALELIETEVVGLRAELTYQHTRLDEARDAAASGNAGKGVKDEVPPPSNEIRASQHICTIVHREDGTYQVRILRTEENKPVWIGKLRKTEAEAVLDLPKLTWGWARLDTDLFDTEVEKRTKEFGAVVNVRIREENDPLIQELHPNNTRVYPSDQLPRYLQPLRPLLEFPNFCSITVHNEVSTYHLDSDSVSLSPDKEEKQEEKPYTCGYCGKPLAAWQALYAGGTFYCGEHYLDY